MLLEMFGQPKTAFAHNISVNYTTAKTRYELVFGTKPQIPMSIVSTGININSFARSSAMTYPDTLIVWTILKIGYQLTFLNYNFHKRF